MNKAAIKKFAVEARTKLIEDIRYRAGLMGIKKEGIDKSLPQSTGQTEFYDIGTADPYSISGIQVVQRRKLVEAIRKKEQDSDYITAYNYIMEEVAYTWFNRLIAIRFMEVNDYLPSHIRVLSSETGKLEPDLVTTPFDAGLVFSAQEEAELIKMKQDNLLDEAFRMLFIKQCNALNEILPALFEVTGHYTELLLNVSFTDREGVVWHLVHDIDEADFDVERGGQVEIIGWMYQYYNTDPKDETFALLKKNVKITKERIPSATQLFTPDWIVRYMVENSLGRLWAEGHPNDELKSNWKYYLEEAEQKPDVQAQLEEIREEYQKLNPEDIRVIDVLLSRLIRENRENTVCNRRFWRFFTAFKGKIGRLSEKHPVLDWKIFFYTEEPDNDRKCYRCRVFLTLWSMCKIAAKKQRTEKYISAPCVCVEA